MSISSAELGRRAPIFPARARPTVGYAEMEDAAIAILQMIQDTKVDSFPVHSVSYAALPLSPQHYGNGGQELGELDVKITDLSAVLLNEDTLGPNNRDFSDVKCAEIPPAIDETGKRSLSDGEPKERMLLFHSYFSFTLYFDCNVVAFLMLSCVPGFSPKFIRLSIALCTPTSTETSTVVIGHRAFNIWPPRKYFIGAISLFTTIIGLSIVCDIANHVFFTLQRCSPTSQL
jgi:hypothetical protein